MSLHFVVLCDISMYASILFVIFDRKIINDANFHSISVYFHTRTLKILGLVMINTEHYTKDAPLTRIDGG